ncbi:hypothetical protein AEMCBJ_10360 [Cupriavidus necator]
MRNKRFPVLCQRAAAIAVAAAAFTLCPTPAGAYDIATSPYLLGDWGGMRTRLEEQGVMFSIGYLSEVAHNFSGGTDHLTRYTDQWAFGATLDLNKLWGWAGGTFQFTMTDRNGRNLGADANIGNNMLIQEVFGRGQTWHLTQLWLNQKLLDERLEIKLGRLTVGEDFFSFSCDFQNLTFCGSQPGNLVGDYWVNWPTSQWATRIKFHASRETYVQTGVYQVNPNYVDDSYARHNGWKPNNPSGTTGVDGGVKATVNGGVWLGQKVNSKGPHAAPCCLGWMVQARTDRRGFSRGASAAHAAGHAVRAGSARRFARVDRR